MKNLMLFGILACLASGLISSCAESPTEPKPDPTPIPTNTPVPSTPTPQPTAIPTPIIVTQSSAAVYFMDVYGDYIYFRTANGVHRANKNGGTMQSLAWGIDLLSGSQWSRGFAIDSQYVYYTNKDVGYKVFRVSMTGGSPEELTNIEGLSSWLGSVSDIDYIAVDSNYIFITSNKGLCRAPISGGTPIMIEEGFTCSDNICVDASYIYFYNDIKLVRKNRLSETSGEGILTLDSFYLDDGLCCGNTYVYYLDDPYHLNRVPKTGGGIETIFDANANSAFHINGNSLWFDGQNVYFGGLNYLRKYSTSTGQVTEYDIAHGYCCWCLTSDSQYVYFYDTNTWTIRKVSK